MAVKEASNLSKIFAICLTLRLLIWMLSPTSVFIFYCFISVNHIVIIDVESKVSLLNWNKLGFI